MANIIIPPGWRIRGLKPTDEKVYRNRRQFVKQLGLAGAGIAISPFAAKAFGFAKQKSGPGIDDEAPSFHFAGMEKFYPAQRNSTYKLDREITEEYDATHYNNYYEFISRQDPNIYNSYKFVGPYDTSDWKFEVSGMVKKKGIYYLADIIKKFGLEERLYRFRCVEAWAMAVPWTGFPLAKLISYLEPQNSAKYIRMISYSNADQMCGVKFQTWYPWPYFEGLRMDEATNELAFLVTGLYGKPLPKQNGAPIRLVVPWKYGYKNTKAIVKMEFVDYEPETFWHKLAPKEYPFLSNVNPNIPHPRWSQAYEHMIPDGEKIPTQMYNGYGEFVGKLY